MNFLEEVYKASKAELKGANIKILNSGKELGLKIEVGNNFNWCESEDEQEQAVSLDKNLIELFKAKNISYNKMLESDFFNLGPDDYFRTCIHDDSGYYMITIYVGQLDIKGTSTLNYWIDFNDMVVAD